MATGEDRDLIQTKVWNKLRAEVRDLQWMSNCGLCGGQELTGAIVPPA